MEDWEWSNVEWRNVEWKNVEWRKVGVEPSLPPATFYACRTDLVLNVLIGS